MPLDKLSGFASVTPETLNKIIDAINRLDGLTVSPPLELNRAAGRYALRYAKKGFMGAITDRRDNDASSSSSSTSSSSQPSNRWEYVVEEVQQDQNGTWIYKPDGRIINTAYEWNDNVVELGTVVFIEPFTPPDNGSNKEDWRFHSEDNGGTGFGETAFVTVTNNPTGIYYPCVRRIENDGPVTWGLAENGYALEANGFPLVVGRNYFCRRNNKDHLNNPLWDCFNCCGNGNPAGPCCDGNGPTCIKATLSCPGCAALDGKSVEMHGSNWSFLGNPFGTLPLTFGCDPCNGKIDTDCPSSEAPCTGCVPEGMNLEFPDPPITGPVWNWKYWNFPRQAWGDAPGWIPCEGTGLSNTYPNPVDGQCQPGYAPGCLDCCCQPISGFDGTLIAGSNGLYLACVNGTWVIKSAGFNFNPQPDPVENTSAGCPSSSGTPNPGYPPELWGMAPKDDGTCYFPNCMQKCSDGLCYPTYRVDCSCDPGTGMIDCGPGVSTFTCSPFGMSWSGTLNCPGGGTAPFTITFADCSSGSSGSSGSGPTYLCGDSGCFLPNTIYVHFTQTAGPGCGWDGVVVACTHLAASDWRGTIVVNGVLYYVDIGCVNGTLILVAVTPSGVAGSCFAVDSWAGTTLECGSPLLGTQTGVVVSATDDCCPGATFDLTFTDSP